jgi:hypothetical protein
MNLKGIPVQSLVSPLGEGGRLVVFARKPIVANAGFSRNHHNIRLDLS